MESDDMGCATRDPCRVFKPDQLNFIRMRDIAREINPDVPDDSALPTPAPHS
jgi:hypothetical protein